MAIHTAEDYLAAQARMLELDDLIDQIDSNMKPVFDDLAAKAHALLANANSDRREKVRRRYWQAYQRLCSVKLARSQRYIDEARQLFIRCSEYERKTQCIQKICSGTANSPVGK